LAEEVNDGKRKKGEVVKLQMDVSENSGFSTLIILF